mmetsp:Transcript_6123/g.9400  ORF Transcript_6123/g.9400 Transcript_6123/m.9400 type:complete len:192 (+) Transcript_6123:1048-1623(+)
MLQCGQNFLKGYYSTKTLTLKNKHNPYIGRQIITPYAHPNVFLQPLQCSQSHPFNATAASVDALPSAGLSISSHISHSVSFLERASDNDILFSIELTKGTLQSCDLMIRSRERRSSSDICSGNPKTNAPTLVSRIRVSTSWTVSKDFKGFAKARYGSLIAVPNKPFVDRTTHITGFKGVSLDRRIFECMVY